MIRRPFGRFFCAVIYTVIYCCGSDNALDMGRQWHGGERLSQQFKHGMGRGAEGTAAPTDDMEIAIKGGL
jgi:hypothetical protein